jgi:dihydroflavonol-4-reductase
MISLQVGRKPPSVRLPYGLVLPMAYVAEGIAKLTGRTGRLTLEGVRMSRKIMFFSSARAVRELGYAWRPPQAAFAEAIEWFRANGRLS